MKNEKRKYVQIVFFEISVFKISKYDCILIFFSCGGERKGGFRGEVGYNYSWLGGIALNLYILHNILAGTKRRD